MYKFYVYIATNKYNKVLYVGVTNNIHRRMFEHEQKINPHSFTARYNICKIIYTETTQYIENAIAREKQIKGLSRQKKVDLINSINPNWDNLLELEFQ